MQRKKKDRRVADHQGEFCQRSSLYVKPHPFEPILPERTIRGSYVCGFLICAKTLVSAENFVSKRGVVEVLYYDHGVNINKARAIRLWFVGDRDFTAQLQWCLLSCNGLSFKIVLYIWLHFCLTFPPNRPLQMTANFARYVLKNPTRVRLLTCDSNQLGVVTKLNQENVRKNLAEKFPGVCNLDQHIYRVTPSIQHLEENCTRLLSDLKNIKSNKALLVPMAFLLVAWLLLVFLQQ